MKHRTGRVLVAAAAVAATAATGAAASTASATAVPASAGRTTAAPSIFGHHSFSLRGASALAARPATSTRMSAAAGGYPLHITTLTKDVLAPLQLAVPSSSNVLVADAALGVIKRIGQKKPVLTGPQPGEIAGVDVNAAGDLAYTWSAFKTGVTGVSIVRKGHKRLDVNLSAWEHKYNPDRVQTYGVRGTPNPCVADFFKKLNFPPTYTGLKDSHPYAVKAVKGGWVVADAAANDLLLVDNRGHVKLLAVVPPQGYTFTAATAQQAGLPGCFAGVTYDFEGVPTDVELGHDGALYFTTLPGSFSESPVPARGSVYRFTLASHHLRRIAGGFAFATNLAITPRGRVLVAEFGAGRISGIYRGHPEPVLNLAGVVGLEFRGDAVYASTLAPFDENGPTGPGSVVKITARW